MLERQFPDGIRRAIALPGSLNPAGSHLNDELSTWYAERFANHATAQVDLGIEDNEVVDALLMKCSSGNDARHATTENKNGGVIRRGGRRIRNLGDYITRDG